MIRDATLFLGGTLFGAGLTLVIVGIVTNWKRSRDKT
jgi:hypothetical protein